MTGLTPGAPRRPRAASVFLLYLVITLILTFPLILHLGEAIPGDSFDGWQNYWNFWWLKQSLVDSPRDPYVTDLLYHPTGVSLYFHTLNPFNGVVSLPVQLTGNLFLAYNAAVLLAFAAGGLGAYLLALTGLAADSPSPPGQRPLFWPAFLAGLIFTFSPYHLAHLLGHMQLIALQWIPFYVLYLLRGLQRAQRGALTRADLFKPGLFLVLVGLCDWYYVVYCLLFTAVALPAAWLALWRQRRRARALPLTALRLLAAPLAAGLLFALVLSPLWLPMVREARATSFMVPLRSEAVRLSADLLGFFTPQGFHPLWGQAVRRWADRTFTSSFSEYSVFAGFTPLFLAGVGVWFDWRRARFWLLSALIFALLALGPVLHIAGRTDLLPGGGSLPLPDAWLYEYIPFMRIARSISRFDVMVMLALGLLASRGAAVLITRATHARRWLGPFLAALVLFEFWPAPYPVSLPDTPAWYQTLAQTPGQGAVLNLPMNWDRPGYLLYQTVHGRPLTVGYISRDDPRTLTTRAPVLQALRALGPDILDIDLTRVGPSVLSWLDVDFVVLDFYKMPGARERTPTVAVAEALFAHSAPVYEDERLRVYQVAKPAAPASFLVLGQGWGERTVAGDTVWRSAAPTATLQIVHGAAAALQMTISGPDGSTLRVLGPDHALIAQATLQTAWQTLTIPLALTGDAVLTLQHDAPGETVRVRRLALGG